MQNPKSIILEAGPLRIVFPWHVDRYAHEIWLRDGIDWIRVLASVEGSPEEAWPASPPFQSLEIADRAATPVALLVGMAGKSHWSASVEMDGRARLVRFEVACRVREGDVGTLGSTYRHCPGPVPCDALAVELERRFGPVELRHSGDLLEIAVPDCETQAARTIRWNYLFRPRPR
jgi:hypothetical protein